MSESLKEYCILYDRWDLLAQWDSIKNGDLTPDKITSGSQRKVWRHCILIWPTNGIPYGMAILARRMFCLGANVLSGGDAARGMSGELRSTPGLRGMVVRSVPEGL
jgi:hypothetical protein